jgi:hypothetical protein
MDKDHKIEPLDDSSLRQILVGWGSTVSAAFLAYLSGGSWWAYFGVFAGLVIAVRGHKPNLFIKHVNAQIIAGIPGRKSESLPKWAGWIAAAVTLGIISSWIHKKMIPEKPDLTKTILDGVKKLLDQQKPDPVGFMQFSKAWFNTKEFSVKETLRISVQEWNAGGRPVDDVWHFFEVKLVPVGPKGDTDDTDQKTHAAMLADAIRDHEHGVDKGERPLTVGAGHGIWFTFKFPPLTQADVNAIIYGHSRIYVYVWARWRGSTRDLDFCEWLQPPWMTHTSAVIDNDKLVWRACRN